MRLFTRAPHTQHTHRRSAHRTLGPHAIASMAYPNMSACRTAKRLSAWATGTIFLLGLLLVVTFLMSCGVKSSPKPQASHWYDSYGLSTPAANAGGAAGTVNTPAASAKK